MKLASLFSDHMVLQRDQEIPVWGWAEPGQTVTVELAGRSAQAIAGADGKWQVRLPALSAGGPHTLTAQATGTEPVLVKDVLVGEVWLCSGQSNMEFTVANVKNATAELAAADHPQIRLFHVPKVAAMSPLSDVKAQWTLCTPETVSTFSAVAYFHAVELQRHLNVPVGLINASWGGTVAEAWTSREGLLAEPSLQSMVIECEGLLAAGEAEIKEYGREYEKWAQTNLMRQIPRNLGLEQGWANPGISREEWGEMDLPVRWQRAGLNFSGVVWFRREVEIPDGWAGKDLALGIGACDKSDWTYFNGEFVGSLTMEDSPNAWSTPRVYTVPGRLVKPGKNIVAVRVYSHLYDAGMTGPMDRMFVKPVGAPDAEAISLVGAWAYRVEHNFGLIPPAPPMPPGPDNPHTPCSLFSGMIAPLVPYAVRGAIWYQGESNAPRAQQYRTLFPTMIRDWRKIWGQKHFHFHLVQLANFMSSPEYPGDSSWAELREAQALALSLPDTGMAVIIDVGDEADIHPTNKQDVGRRLAWSALARIHGVKDVTASGPLYKAHQIEGGQVRLSFELFGSPLELRANPLKPFAVAGEDRKFFWADARIDGDTVVVSSEKVKAPVAVRYGWSDNPPCTLYNRAGLPASPFRTDDWPLTTL